MKQSLFTFCLILALCPILGLCQKGYVVDSVTFAEFTEKRPFPVKQMIIPGVLGGTALLLNNGDFEQELQPKINQDLRTNIDDYTRFAPLALMYGADALGVQAENHWFDQSKNAALSLLLTQLITTGIKRSTAKTRPNNFNDEALPSGHTSLAFASATVLYEEFKNTEPLLAYSGYAFASTTAYLRMAKNKHWLSDVLLGSALGIAVTKLVYHFDYLFAWNPFKGPERLVVLPKLDFESSGVYLALRF
ncbi:phosphatase PAP2 family protein [Poritiphilus flavus]|uniref:Phosphatase PAP2 family protein n=1 Tax=Poritiphilus flavus TaxID=2697053 RepID=A0A6L9EF37_9FLAO|nr:phosphatase PAP2 family protein [Poritiphilus flavus]NAS13336.1 phosphatase PAP2 family protein [Poritiphilus flavus]